MPLQPYKSYDLFLLFDGQEPVCITGITLELNTTTVNKVDGATGQWKSYRSNLQGFIIDVEGLQGDGYQIFKAAGKTQVPFRLRTSDFAIDEVGFVTVERLKREVGFQDNTFSVTLRGQTAITQNDTFDFLLIEDGDFLLQEDGDKIRIP